MLATQRYAAANNRALTSALGRTPDDAELYLAHQQGPGGAVKLLTHPGVRAGDLVGDAAIKGNGGNPDAPASAFTAMWTNKFNHTHGAPPVPTFIAEGMTSPTAVPTDAPPLPTMSPDGAPPARRAGSDPDGTGRHARCTQPVAATRAPFGRSNRNQPRRPVLALAGPGPGFGPRSRDGRRRPDPGSHEHRRGEPALRGAEPRDLHGAHRARAAPSRPHGGGFGRCGRRDPAGKRRLPPLPAAKARQIIDEFHANQAVGGLMRGVQWASPQQLAEMQRDISSGQGVYSDSLRVHRGAATTGPAQRVLIRTARGTSRSSGVAR